MSRGVNCPAVREEAHDGRNASDPSPVAPVPRQPRRVRVRALTAFRPYVMVKFVNPKRDNTAEETARGNVRA